MIDEKEFKAMMIDSKFTTEIKCPTKHCDTTFEGTTEEILTKATEHYLRYHSDQM